MTTVYVSIGNSDDKLTQAEWAAFCADVSREIAGLGNIHGAWFSSSFAPWQNACWCAEFSGPGEEAEAHVLAEMRGVLGDLARKYRQDSIAWAVAPVTAFIRRLA